jgi:hypothetical protein
MLLHADVRIGIDHKLIALNLDRMNLQTLQRNLVARRGGRSFQRLAQQFCRVHFMLEGTWWLRSKQELQVPATATGPNSHRK